MAHLLTNVSGSSEYFPIGVITYSNQWKKKLLGVSEETLERYGAVSEETVFRMAIGVRMLADTDLGLAISGIAGPLGGTLEKPVGTVYIALSTENACQVDVHHFEGNRERIKNLSALFALHKVRQWCLQDQEN